MLPPLPASLGEWASAAAVLTFLGGMLGWLGRLVMRRTRSSGSVRVETTPVRGLGRDYTRAESEHWVTDASVVLFNDTGHDLAVHGALVDLRGRAGGKRATGAHALGDDVAGARLATATSLRFALRLSMIAELQDFRQSDDAPITYRVRVRLGNGRWVRSSWTTLPANPHNLPSSGDNSDVDF